LTIAIRVEEVLSLIAKPEFSEDDLTQLHLLLSQELESGRIELHHTAGRPYREYLKRRMAQQEVLLRKLEDAVPALRAGGEDRWTTDGGAAPAG
jgi:hypothetical protein